MPEVAEKLKNLKKKTLLSGRKLQKKKKKKTTKIGIISNAA